MISGREAANRLASAGLSRRQARIVLDAGLAGAPIRSRSVTLYDPSRVDDLVGRGQFRQEDLPDVCPIGVLVDRRVADASSGLPLSPWTALHLQVVIQRAGSFPYVATIGGFVVTGADLVGVHGEGEGLYRLERTAPGKWFDSFRGRRWAIGPGASVLVCGQPRDWLSAVAGATAVGESPT
jgi:hypothetical protein